MSAGRRFDRCVIDRVGKLACTGTKTRIVVANQRCRSGVEGALRRKSGDGGLMRRGLRPQHLHLAVMCSITSAAGWQVRVGICGEREQRRNQRKAEEQQQRKCQEAAHTAIVADGAYRIEESGNSPTIWIDVSLCCF